MIVVKSKDAKTYFNIECCHCFQNITSREENLDKCPYCLEELPQPLDLVERAGARVAYFFIGDE